jgi:FAD/FMN-containing dehydrogenase
MTSSERGSARLTRRAFLLGAAATTAAAALPAWSLASASRASVPARRMRELASATRGPLVTRLDAGLFVAAQVWNARFDGRRPAGVLYALDARDVQAAVRWAARYGVPITARAGGHCYQGYSTINDGLVVDLTNLSEVVPRYGRVPYARVGGGASLGVAYRALSAVGRTIPGGTCPTVSVGGLAQGGGMGMVARRWGPLSDNVLGFRIVTPDGRIRDVGPGRDRDLFWACRGGGGGNFGIITSYDIRTHPTDPAMRFVFRFAWSECADVVLAWQDWAHQTGDGLFTMCGLVTNPGDAEPIIQVSGQYFGDEAGLAAEVAPLLARVTPTSRDVTAASYASLIQHWAECTHAAADQCARQAANPGPGGVASRPMWWGKSDYVGESSPMPRAGAEAMRDHVASLHARGFATGEVLLDSYGGAINRVSPTATAFAHRDMRYSIQYVAYWSDTDWQGPSVRWLRSLERALRPHVTGQKYINYIDSDQRNRPEAYYGRNLDRLIDTRRRFDPDDVFRFRQAIPLRRGAA